MQPDERRRLGATGIEVTALGFGTAPIGGFRGAIDDAEALGTLRAALEAGIRYIDTAPFYGYGAAALRTGAVLRVLPREGYVLSIKIGRTIKPIRDGDDLTDLRPGGLIPADLWAELRREGLIDERVPVPVDHTGPTIR